MKFKQKKSSKSILSDKIADALTVRPRADIEDDHIFNTKPNTVSRADYSSESEDEAAISDFRKRTANLLSDISKKYEGEVVSRKELEDSVNSSDLSDGESNYATSGKGLDDSNNGLSDDDLPGKHEMARSSNGSEDDSENDDDGESADYSILKTESKTIPNKLPGKVDGTSSDEDGEENDYSMIKKQIQGESDEDQSDASGEEEEDEEEDEGEGFDISQLNEPVQEEFEHVKRQNVSEEGKKGACVRNQLLIWESLLEMRIHLQRCMNTANMMPMSDKYGELKDCKEFAEESNVTMNNVSTVLDKFLTLQNLLLKNFPDTKKISNKNQMEKKANAKEESDEEIPSDTDNEEIPSDTEPEDDVIQEKSKPGKTKSIKTMQKKRKLEDYESDLITYHKGLKTFRETTIQKWNEKTRLTTAANIKNTPTNTILQQISYILSDRNKLIRRTQLKRSDYDIIGYNKSTEIEKSEEINIGENGMTKDRKDNDEYITEIFDDSDFYHQLLRELIECKSADISDPVQLSRQWIALQQMRSKMKRKVDTRATKGRKIKYVVHNPLVSYMAPEKSLKWNEESTNELYSSLFGKIFENNNVGMNVDLENVNIK
ncbi:protein AATF [Pararge aegeria]|uniref:protein AATF n=1 Tax=Pararge aegeria TaxID=116150 RepID=UPI0019D25E61|nr:protein AATF [Pararge aegeria]